MNVNNDETTNGQDDDARHELTMFEVYDGTRKKANYSNLRATDIPTVQRLFPPKTGTMLCCYVCYVYFLQF